MKFEARDHKGGLCNGIRILEAFDSMHTRMTVTEAAHWVGLSPASARRLPAHAVRDCYAQTDRMRYGLARPWRTAHQLSHHLGYVTWEAHVGADFLHPQ